MNLHPNHSSRLGLTLFELLLVIVVIAILGGLLLPVFHRGDKSTRVACINNLKQVTLGEIVWANDHGHEALPAQLSTNVGGFQEIALQAGLVRYYTLLSNELSSPRILVCPSDRWRPVDEFALLTTNHLSYFLNVDAGLDTNMTVVFHGDRQIEFSPRARGQLVTLATDTTMRWAKDVHSSGIGNISHADGSVESVSNGTAIEEVFHASKSARHRLVFP